MARCRLYVFVVLFFLPSFSVCWGQQGVEGWLLSGSKLRGQVKEVIEKKYRVSQSNRGGDSCMLSSEIRTGFDRSGNIVTIYGYDSIPAIRYFITTSFDKRGRLRRAVIHDPDGSTTSEIVPTYNEDGYVTCCDLINSQGAVVSRYEVDYDRDGCKTEQRRYNEKKSLVSKWMKYNSDGLPQENYSYDERGEPYLKISSLYNDGKLIEDRWSAKNGVIIAIFKYSWDKYKNLLSEKMYSMGSLLSSERYEYIYDDVENWIQRLHYEDNVVVEKTTRSLAYY